MKISKRAAACLASAIMAFCTVSAFASESGYSDVPGDEKGEERLDESVDDFLDDFNAGKKDEKDLAAVITLMSRMTDDPEIRSKLSEAALVADEKISVTGFSSFSLKGMVPNEEGKYELTISAPAYIESLKNPVFLCYAVTEDGTAYFEAVEPKSYHAEYKGFTIEIGTLKFSQALFADR